MAHKLTQAPTAPVLMALFMFTLILPVSIEVAGLRLSPTRIYLLIAFIPLMIHLLSKKAGKIYAADIFMFLYSFWIILTFLYHDGMGRFAYSVISVVELLGGYLVGRCLIRGRSDFKYMFKSHLAVMCILFPFALLDFATNNELWARIMDVFGNTFYRSESSRPRLGFQRVMTGFEHPILFGIFCSIAVGNIAYILRGQGEFFKRWTRVGFATFMTLMSLSSGALLSALMQIGLIIWDWVTSARWKMLLVIVVLISIFLEFASNRGPVIIFIETLTFSSATAWTRVIQWEYGSAEVLRNPIFGKGLTGDWIRPAWLYTSSIDAYWLVIAFRHGLPGIGFLLAAMGCIVWGILKVKNLAHDVALMRTGYLITLAGIFFSLVTVHIWGALSVFVYTYLGAGLWFLQEQAQAEDPGKIIQPPKPVSNFSRATGLHYREAQEPRKSTANTRISTQPDRKTALERRHASVKAREVKMSQLRRSIDKDVTQKQDSKYSRANKNSSDKST